MLWHPVPVSEDSLHKRERQECSHLVEKMGIVSSLKGDDLVVTLRFKVLDPSMPGGLEVSEMLVSDPQGGINELLGAHLENIRTIPTEFGLSRNYPNPFNPATVIDYQIAGSGPVTLAIFNLMGQEIRVIVRDQQPAGYYEVIWEVKDASGRHTASRVYLYRLQGGANWKVQKMVLLK